VQWVDRPDRIFSVSPDGTAPRLDEAAHRLPLEVEGRAQAHVHVAGDAALELVGGGRLVDVQARDRLDRQVLVGQAAAS